MKDSQRRAFQALADEVIPQAIREQATAIRLDDPAFLIEGAWVRVRPFAVNTLIQALQDEDLPGEIELVEGQPVAIPTHEGKCRVTLRPTRLEQFAVELELLDHKSVEWTGTTQRIQFSYRATLWDSNKLRQQPNTANEEKPLSISSVFPADYEEARERFREAAQHLDWRLEAHPIEAVGPSGEPLTIDVACSATEDADNVLVISSGLHGVEGFFGSAVQTALLEQWVSSAPPTVRCVFLHALNPYGFALIRRSNEDNVDLNRNFLLPGEAFEGAPEGYARLDSFLNPHRPPSRWEPYTLKALWLISRHGMRTLKQSIAAGQYEFPRGLFFGGANPSQTQLLLAEHMPRWLDGSQRVVHLDLHTGLGQMASWKLLIDYPLTTRQRNWFAATFGPGSFEESDPLGVGYGFGGGFGQWCVFRKLAPEYLFACAEFGTYSPIQVLAGLRAENQAHHWGKHSSTGSIDVKANLKELFCPASPDWRSAVIERSLDIVERASRGMVNGPSDGVNLES